MASATQYCSFRLAHLLCGVEVAQVQEVLRVKDITPVPRAPRVVSGLMNLRGQLVLALDLRLRLGLPPRAETRAPVNIVVRTAEGATSLLVDDIGEVLEVPASSFEQPPDALRGITRQLIRGVCKLKQQLLLILDLPKTIDFASAVNP